MERLVNRFITRPHLPSSRKRQLGKARRMYVNFAAPRPRSRPQKHKGELRQHIKSFGQAPLASFTPSQPPNTSHFSLRASFLLKCLSRLLSSKRC